MIGAVAASDEALIEYLIKLGDASSKTLGMLRPAVYRDAASKGCLLVARQGDDVAGYTLFRRPRSEVALTHVCVAQEYRCSGVARSLVDRVSALHPTRLGLLAKCRNDYGIDASGEL